MLGAIGCSHAKEQRHPSVYGPSSHKTSATVNEYTICASILDNVFQFKPRMEAAWMSPPPDYRLNLGVQRSSKSSSSCSSSSSGSSAREAQVSIVRVRPYCPRPTSTNSMDAFAIHPVVQMAFGCIPRAYTNVLRGARLLC